MKGKKPFVSVVITAGGSGRRFSQKENDLPKQFKPLCGVPIIRRAIRAFEETEEVNEIIVSLPEDFVRDFPLEGEKIRAPVAGGSDRQASVYAALKNISKEADIVLIHDGVRPLVTRDVIRRVTACAQTGFAAIAGTKATDTIKQATPEGIVISTPDRDGLWIAQTPQGFTYEVIMKAHEMAEQEGFAGTDDAMLAERYGLAPVKMVESGKMNLKITTEFDMFIAEAYLKSRV